MAKETHLNEASFEFVDNNITLVQEGDNIKINNAEYLAISRDYTCSGHLKRDCTNHDFGLQNKISGLKVNINGSVYDTYARSGSIFDTGNICVFCVSCHGECVSCTACYDHCVNCLNCNSCETCTDCRSGCYGSCVEKCVGSCFDDCNHGYDCTKCNGCKGNCVGCVQTCYDCRGCDGSTCNGCNGCTRCYKYMNNG